MTFEKSNFPHTDAFATHTVAQLKGRRLRMARALTGFSRQELYEKIGIATSTIDTWESGRVELTEKSAMRVCSALRNVGLCCTIEWLLTGNGIPPRLMDEIERSILLPADSRATLESANIHNENLPKYKKIPHYVDENVSRELSFFMSIHKNAIFHIVENDSFHYKIGDCVAGIEEDTRNLIGKVVIAVLKNGRTALCRLLTHSNSEYLAYFDSSTPKKTINIEKAAEIIWHRTIKRLTS